MGGFSPQPGVPGKRTLFDGVEAEGMGPIFLISSLLVAPVTGYSSLLGKRPVVAVTLRVFSEFRRGSVSVQATFDI